MPNSKCSLTRIDSAIVGMIDIVSSTPAIMGNPHHDHEVRARLMTNIIGLMTQTLSPWATTVSFTGDGVLFYITEKTQRILPRIEALSLNIDEQFGLRLGLRVGFAAGVIFRGNVGPGPNIVGVPVVEVARLLQEKSFFPNGIAIVATAGALNEGAGTLWEAARWRSVSSTWKPAGLGSMPVSVCCYTSYT